METKMKTIFALALLAMLGISNANAAGISYPASVTGKWCFAEANDGWTYFKRSTKCEEMTLVLQKNGDYVITDGKYVERCKADPKSYFKGWTDYTCTTINGVQKKNMKFTSYAGQPGKLGLTGDDNDEDQ
jgi:hypothetical protein